MTDCDHAAASINAEEFCETLKFIHQKGWSPGTGGNFSFVYSQSPLILKMAPSGIDKGMVMPDHLICVNSDRQVVDGQGKASAETAIHLSIINTLEARVVLHGHSIFNTLLSDLFLPQGCLEITGYEMLKGVIVLLF